MTPLPDPWGDGDRPAFEAMFNAYADRLCRFIVRYVRSWEEAEELVQDVFLALWLRRDELRGVRNLDAFLYTYARNRALDHLKRQRVSDRHKDELASAEQAPMAAALVEQPIEDIEAAIQRAVDALPSRQREVILLRWREHLSYDSIATRLGIAPRTVAVHLQRAADRLRELLG
jgi:RNA polymerase sigma-70 factor, ECF subfamily